MRAVAWLAPLVLLSACATVEVGRELDLAAFEAKARQGVTTQDEVRAWLGAPPAVGMSVESSGERYEQWTYYHAKGRLPALADAQVSILQVKFDPRGVIRAYNWSGERR
jgi:type II secretory pathway component PulK